MKRVSSVPLRSPFRYPGGKTWLVPMVRHWLNVVEPTPMELFEPFAGGGIVGLTAAFERLVPKVTLVEIDPDVGAVWSTMLGQDAEWLADAVEGFELSLENVRETLAAEPKSLRERAFATLLKNRVNRGGILANGAGLMKHGENGKGLWSRWYPNTLRDRILAIHSIRDRVRFVQGDGMAVILANAAQLDAAFFVDPPYTADGKRAGLRLYKFSVIDHSALFSEMNRVKGRFLMTYDEAPKVKQLALEYRFGVVRVPMQNTHHTGMNELLISRDLAWADSCQLVFAPA